MKIAIKANPSRGTEIISLLESLGGITTTLSGKGKTHTYYIDEYNKIRYANAPKDYKVYTLEEFETQFPFKVGDLCIYSSDNLGKDIVVKILGMRIENDCIMYEVGHKDITDGHSHIYRKRETLKPYKEMKEERNITLTLDKAKEWYKKGGELKEVALQAYSEKELIRVELPKTWEEFCDNYTITDTEAHFDSCCTIYIADITNRHPLYDRNICPSKESAKAHLALIQLEQLRDCWRQGWEPTPHQAVFAIKFAINGLGVYEYCSREFLSFKDRKTATEFLKCFKDLIEQAGDLI